MKVVAAREDRPGVAERRCGEARRSLQDWALQCQEGMGPKAEGRSPGPLQKTCSPLVSHTLGLGERVTFPHSSGPPSLSGQPEWGEDRSHQ